MKTALIAEKMKKRSARSGAWEWTCPGGSAFFAGSFPLPRCLSRLKLGGPRQFSEKIRVFYRHLCLMAEIALEQTGSTVIAFSPEEVAQLLGVSPTTVRNWIAYFIHNGLLVPINRIGGRGKKAQFLFQIETQQQVVPSPFSTTTLRTPPPTAPSRQPETTHATKKTTETPPKNRPEDTQIPPPKSSAAQQRAEKLRALPDETRVVGKFFNWVMEFYRHRCWENACTREESDIICNAIGRQIKGKTLGEARKLATWFLEHVRHVIENLREALQKGLRAAYALLAYLFRKALGILKPNPKPYKKPASTAKKPWRWDLNDPEERKAFLKVIEKMINEGGGLCLRCGNVIRVEYWTVSAALAFQDPDGCRCLYIALDRDAREREKHYQLEKEKREALGHAIPAPRNLGIRIGDLLTHLMGGATPPPDSDPDPLKALEDPKEIHRLSLKSLAWAKREHEHPPRPP